MAFIRFILNFDQMMLDIFERLCHKQQRFFGVTHYFWLKWIALIYGSLFAVFVYPNIPPEERYEGFASLSLLLLAGTIGFTLWERASYTRLSKGLANPLRRHAMMICGRWMICYFQTTMLSVGGALMLFQDVFEGMYTLAVAAFIFVFSLLVVLPACDPLPPTPGKLKALIKNMLIVRRTSTSLSQKALLR